jgi:hypothetical protein
MRVEQDHREPLRMFMVPQTQKQGLKKVPEKATVSGAV